MFPNFGVGPQNGWFILKPPKPGAGLRIQMDVSKNRGKKPQNGWFISWKTLSFNGWFGGNHYFWKHPVIGAHPTIFPIWKVASPMFTPITYVHLWPSLQNTKVDSPWKVAPKKRRKVMAEQQTQSMNYCQAIGGCLLKNWKSMKSTIRFIFLDCLACGGKLHISWNHTRSSLYILYVYIYIYIYGFM